VRICTSPTTDYNRSCACRQHFATVRDLGVYLDADVSMAAHVTATVKACFASLRQIRIVRRSLSREALLTLIRALIVNKLDYCCSVLAGVSGTLQRRLQMQSVFNATARLVFSARKSEHVTPLLQELHWLKVLERIQFRLCVLVHRCLHGNAPPYLAETLRLTLNHAAISGLGRHRHYSCRQRDEPL